MIQLVRAFDNKNSPIVDQDNQYIRDVYFNLIRLDKGQSVSFSLPLLETVWVVLSGTIDMTVDDQKFDRVGMRKDIWSGPADSVYAPPGSRMTATALADGTEIAVAGGRCQVQYQAFRVFPAEIDTVEVGSSATKSHRRIDHILGQKQAGRTGNLLVSELFCEEGCWSGYPPHKHDETRDGETAHAEVYHYRFDPENGFGAQFNYDDPNNPGVVMTRSGDTVLVPSGYHPTATSPGHREYIFTILVGRDQRSLVQWFEPQYRHLMAAIPGIDDMRNKFK
jgi:5-deoxy-glucuronate isomerase